MSSITAVDDHRAASRVDQPTTPAAALTALGIVYGDLGTSPLYTLIPRQVENRSDLANQVIVRNSLFKAKRIKQLPLVVIETPHHRPPPPRIASETSESPRAETINGFRNKICQLRTHALQQNSISFVPAGTGWPLRAAYCARNHLGRRAPVFPLY
jgi:hypothetical protein